MSEMEHILIPLKSVLKMIEQKDFRFCDDDSIRVREFRRERLWDEYVNNQSEAVAK